MSRRSKRNRRSAYVVRFVVEFSEKTCDDDWRRQIRVARRVLGVRVLRKRKLGLWSWLGDVTDIHYARVRMTPRHKFRRYAPRKWFCRMCGWVSGGWACRVGDLCSNCDTFCNESVVAADGACPTCGCGMQYSPVGGVYCVSCDSFVDSNERRDAMDVNPALVEANHYDATHMGMVAAIKTLIEAHNEHMAVLDRLYHRSSTDTEARYYLDASVRQTGFIDGLRAAAALIDTFVLPE